MNVRSLSTDAIRDEIARRDAIIAAEPWINGGKVARVSVNGHARKRRPPADYAAAIRKLPRKFSPPALASIARTTNQAATVWLSVNAQTGKYVRRVSRGVYERRGHK